MYMSLSVSSLATVTFFLLVSEVLTPVARNLRRFLGGWKSVKNAVGQRCFAVLSQTDANNNKKARAQKIKTFFFAPSLIASVNKLQCVAKKEISNEKENVEGEMETDDGARTTAL